MNRVFNFNGKEFNCGCRKWLLTEKDITAEPTEPTFEIHRCDKIIVRQRKGGLTRYFIRSKPGATPTPAPVVAETVAEESDGIDVDKIEF